ncbi:MAG: prepilin-type N-terminal cleavage/methylation domain-containing protein [Patescibacteria group bacterium]|nr:prepilin-type N-terminal cleavage/methylation domain-containing protein [Patescibacteria group bacterium]MCL5258065.1 prepilin-type N-terminal cleavage/methylation domain-containing protein [Patescibacteria group bacterium]
MKVNQLVFRKNNLNYRKILLKIKKKSFTLIEILIVLSIIAILAAVLILILKPGLIFAKARDAQRMTDLSNINNAVNIYLIDNPANFIGTSSIVYTSLPDTSSTCGAWSNQLPTLPSGWTYNCVSTANYKNTNGTGWLPINFASDTMINLNQLPVDPSNNPPYYYTYIVNGGYEFAAKLEYSNNTGLKSGAGQDGGLSWNYYEIGTNLSLAFQVPQILLRELPADTFAFGLIGHWPLNDGSGLIAQDTSGYNNNGTLTAASSTCQSCLPQWVTISNKAALSFSSSSQNYVFVSSTPNISTNNSIAAWVYETSFNNGNLLEIPYHSTPTSTSCNVSLYSNSSGGYGYFSYFQNGNFYEIGTTTTLPAWHFLTGTYNGSLGKFYLDGNLIGTSSLISTINSSGGFHISAWVDSSGNNCWYSPTADIREVQYYNRPLTAAEIQTLYNSEK